MSVPARDADDISFLKGLLAVSPLAAVLLLRLVIWKFFPGAETGVKEDLSNMIVAGVQVAAGVAVLAIFMYRKQRIAASVLDIPALGLLVAAAVSLCWTVDLSSSLRGVLALAGEVIFCFVLVQSLRDTAGVRALLLLMAAMALLAAIFGIREFYTLSRMTPPPEGSEMAVANHSLQYILTHRRVTSFLGWPNSLAGYLTLILPFVLVLAVTVKDALQRALAWVVLAVMVGGLFVTFSLLGWFSFLIASFLMAPAFLRTFAPEIADRSKGLLYQLAAVFGILFVGVFLHKNIAESLAPRLIYYKNAFTLIAQKPFWGQGWYTFGVASKALSTSIDGLTGFVHNSYVQWWVECGFWGVLAEGFFLFVIVRMSCGLLARTNRTPDAPLVVAVVWGVAAFLIDNLFSFTWIKPNIAVHGWALIAILAALDRILGGEEKRAWVRPPFLSGAALAVSVFSLLMITVLSTGMFYYHAGVRAFQRGDVDRAGEYFVQGSLIDRWSASYTMTAGDMALRVYQSTGRVYYLHLGETNYLEAIRREPLQYVPHFMLGQIYLALGDPKSSLFYMREARRISPFEFNRDSTAVAQGRNEPTR